MIIFKSSLLKSIFYKSFYKPNGVISNNLEAYFMCKFSRMSSYKSNKIAVCQLSCTSDREKNFQICNDLINKAIFNGAKMIFLPECFDHVGESKEQSMQLAEPLNGVLLSKYKAIAKTNSIFLSLGGYHEKDTDKNSNKVHNSHIIIDDYGEIVAVYRKIHLFDIDIPGGIRLKESDYTLSGSQIMHPVNTPIGKVGLGICYDMRFPEFSLSLVKAGAEILTYPSSFTQTTGMAHWEPLLRCRAIESQCYVVAAAQTGRHNPKRSSYGHAMIIDPWGCVIASCSEGIGIALADINLEYVHQIKTEMPIWNHRRADLYGFIIPANINDENVSYIFGNIQLLPEQIFYKTPYSMAFVNKKPVLPGHVLVAPLRCAKRLSDLSQLEINDLFMCVQNVQKKIELEFNVSSSTISIQDGPDAGQTVPHIHIHILPRKPGDFKHNDDIYYELETHDKLEKDNWRTPEEMASEAEKLRKHFC